MEKVMYVVSRDNGEFWPVYFDFNDNKSVEDLKQRLDDSGFDLVEDEPNKKELN